MTRTDWDGYPYQKPPPGVFAALDRDHPLAPFLNRAVVLFDEGAGSIARNLVAGGPSVLFQPGTSWTATSDGSIGASASGTSASNGLLLFEDQRVPGNGDNTSDGLFRSRNFQENNGTYFFLVYPRGGHGFYAGRDGYGDGWSVNAQGDGFAVVTDFNGVAGYGVGQPTSGPGTGIACLARLDRFGSANYLRTWNGGSEPATSAPFTSWGLRRSTIGNGWGFTGGSFAPQIADYLLFGSFDSASGLPSNDMARWASEEPMIALYVPAPPVIFSIPGMTTGGGVINRLRRVFANVFSLRRGRR